MSLTKQNISYSKIEKYVKGITLMSRGSINFLKAAYGGELEKASKLLANYSWRYTRDTTLVLITAAVLVLAEKSTEAHPEIQQAVDDLDNDMVKKLFIAMAKGSSAQVKVNVDCLGDVFKAVLKGGDMETKADDAWKKFKAYISKIKPWKHSTNAVVDYVKPILKASLEQSLYSSLKNNLLLDENEQPGDENNLPFKEITNPLFSDKSEPITVDGKKVNLYCIAVTHKQNYWTKESVKITHNGITTYYLYNATERQICIGLSTSQLQLIIKRHKLNTSEKLKSFLVKHLSSLFKKMDNKLNDVVKKIRTELRKGRYKMSELDRELYGCVKDLKLYEPSTKPTDDVYKYGLRYGAVFTNAGKHDKIINLNKELVKMVVYKGGDDLTNLCDYCKYDMLVVNDDGLEPLEELPIPELP